MVAGLPAILRRAGVERFPSANANWFPVLQSVRTRGLFTALESLKAGDADECETDDRVGMRAPALVQALADAAGARGEVPWQSQETPPRPPMLAAFGSVRAWMMTPEDIVRERPGAPPSTSSSLMERELAEVKDPVEGHLAGGALTRINYPRAKSCLAIAHRRSGA